MSNPRYIGRRLVRRSLVVVLLTQALTGAIASTDVKASGLNLSWDDCGSAGTDLKAFACDTNAGQSTLVASVVAPSAINYAYVFSVVFTFQFTEPDAPDWWKFYNPGSCRMSNVTSNLSGAGLSGCVDYWAGHGAGGFATYASTVTPQNFWRLTMTLGVPSANAGPWTPEAEYFLCKIVIDHQNTAGSGSCSGCERGADFVFDRCTIGQDGQGPSIDITNVASRNSVKWNGGFTPTLNKTWGQIKALYR